MCFKLSSVILVFLNQVNDNPKKQGGDCKFTTVLGKLLYSKNVFVSYAKKNTIKFILSLTLGSSPASGRTDLNLNSLPLFSQGPTTL